MGKPKHSDDSRGEQKGAQQHAQGWHGPKSFRARKNEIRDHERERGPRSQRAANDPNFWGEDAEKHEMMIDQPLLARDGRHRLVENRLQHDEAEKNSDKTRASRDVERHHHDKEGFQIPGGRETHPKVPQDGPPRTIKPGGQGGGNRARIDHGHS